MKKLEDVTTRNICNDVFGDFKPFKEMFENIQFGGLPTAIHPNPRAVAMIRRMDDWPDTFTRLKHMRSLCYVCQNNTLFSPCKMCLKAVVGECKNLFEEATKEDARVRREINKKRGNK